MPGQHALDIYQGDVYVLPFQLNKRVPDGEGDYTLEPIDISDHDVYASIKRNERADEPVAVFKTAVTDGPDGKLELTLTHEESMKLTRNGEWDLVTVAPANKGGTVRTWLRDEVNVTRRITNVPSTD